MPGFFQRYFLRHLGLKVISLLLAIGLWVVVARDPIAEVEIKVPIEFHNLPENLEIDSASFTEAQVRGQAEAWPRCFQSPLRPRRPGQP